MTPTSHAHRAGEMSFAEFLTELQTVFEKYYGKHEPSQARRYVYDNEDEWREYFDDGYTARQAADEDQHS